MTRVNLKFYISTKKGAFLTETSILFFSLSHSFSEPPHEIEVFIVYFERADMTYQLCDRRVLEGGVQMPEEPRCARVARNPILLLHQQIHVCGM
jgi:hypothetical protein